MKPLIIGLMGKAGSGKNTAAFRMGKLTQVQEEAFAARFKPFVMNVFSFHFEQVHGNKKEVRDLRGVNPTYWAKALLRLNSEHGKWLDSLGLWGEDSARRTLFAWFFDVASEALDEAHSFTPRRVMQTLGTEWGREIDPELWAKATLRKIRKENNLAKVVAITDCRFVNEFHAIKEAGGVVWKIEGDTTTQETGHASEMEIDRLPLTDFDHVVRNDKTKPIDELDRQILAGLLKANVKAGA